MVSPLRELAPATGLDPVTRRLTVAYSIYFRGYLVYIFKRNLLKTAVINASHLHAFIRGLHFPVVT